MPDQNDKPDGPETEVRESEAEEVELEDLDPDI